MSDKLDESMKKLQQKAQKLCLDSGYHRSLERFHAMMAENIEKELDFHAKKIRNLESNTPKKQGEKDVQSTTDPKETTDQPISGGEMGTSEVA